MNQIDEHLNVVRYWFESDLHHMELDNGEVYISEDNIHWSLLAHNVELTRRPQTPPEGREVLCGRV